MNTEHLKYGEPPAALYIELASLLVQETNKISTATVRAVQQWTQANGVVAGFSYWPEIIDGTITVNSAATLDTRIAQLYDGKIAVVEWCMHSQNQIEPIAYKCACMKPHPGLLYACKHDLETIYGPISHPGSLMIGLDDPDNHKMAESFNIEFMTVKQWIG